MCATEYSLAKYCGVTFARIKPASLFTITQENSDKLRFLSGKFRSKGFVFVLIRSRNCRTLVFIYNKDQMKKVLFDSDNLNFLNKRGYYYKTVSQAIALLKEKLIENDFPHEIGIFLGYPLDDVQGFIEKPFEKALFSGYWKVYYDLQKKLNIFKRYRRCTDCICRKIECGESLTKIFNIE